MSFTSNLPKSSTKQYLAESMDYVHYVLGLNADDTAGPSLHAVSLEDNEKLDELPWAPPDVPQEGQPQNLFTKIQAV
jgi:hypothetical protein